MFFTEFVTTPHQSSRRFTQFQYSVCSSFSQNVQCCRGPVSAPGEAAAPALMPLSRVPRARDPAPAPATITHY
ncbi:hypothetical protein EVAR_32161_1 [Eumeta japonica]|uniref:Uncharacterized protein n=1 Tax=Eumeta variegata TaxID=151549 RepID=A0A4C1W0K2_EUMVA|nr:hypothetical protein EVAR_32161_1 [Eumeta japonica]